MGLLAALAVNCEANGPAAPEQGPSSIAASESSDGTMFGSGLPVTATPTAPATAPNATAEATSQGSCEPEVATGTSGTGTELLPSTPDAPASSPTHDASSDIATQPDATTPVTASVSASASNTSDAAGGMPNGDPEPSPDAGNALPMQDASVSDLEYPALPDTLTLHVIGDSTAATFPDSDATHRVGWASVLQMYFAASVTVDNGAQSGRSSKSFMDEGHWDNMKPTLRAGDYVFIQFGHNDEKSEDPTRYTDPNTTYRANLETYIDDSRDAGAVPVLLTPISRRKFDGPSIAPTHGDYPAAVIAVGLQTNTPVIDLTEKTRVLLEDLGDAASVSLFADGDNTHLSAKGAAEVSALAVNGIAELELPIAQRLAP